MEKNIKENKRKSKTWLERIVANILMPNTTADFFSLVNLAVKKRIINTEARDMIKGVINVSSLQVKKIMIPRIQMATIDLDMEYNLLLNTVITSSHTRLPVFSKDTDSICGILHTKDLLKIIQCDKKFSLEHLKNALRPAIFVPESKKLDVLLREFKSSKNHLAIVVNEYGCISGLVTIEDILEEIVGNIEDEFDEEEIKIIHVDENQYIINALTPIEDFNNFFGIITNDKVETVGGLIINRLKRLPGVGEEIAIDSLKFKVIEADKRRILTLQVVSLS